MGCDRLRHGSLHDDSKLCFERLAMSSVLFGQPFQPATQGVSGCWADVCFVAAVALYRMRFRNTQTVRVALQAQAYVACPLATMNHMFFNDN